MSIYDFEVIDGEGNAVSLSQYKNKVLLIVNSATKSVIFMKEALKSWIFHAISSTVRLQERPRRSSISAGQNGRCPIRSLTRLMSTGECPSVV